MCLRQVRMVRLVAERMVHVAANFRTALALGAQSVEATQPSPGKRKTPLLRHCILKSFILPRQAQDKHRENGQKETRFPYYRYANDLGSRAVLGFSQYQRQDLIGGRWVLWKTVLLLPSIISLLV
eukprot:COSAG06_NODE_887_length_11768_cov_28.624732_6_plen_125_part_00